ncbi:hypothetical protein NPIL_196371 [Nephila pilipes]|uniref:Uncharacterized protein n=1 Tax=Nephila pilipes TaxID=299642 RepID=A0A8X6NG77_NEPPI|nr:hypothetical protein NPIL_196371 [Nephila pilipes]
MRSHFLLKRRINLQSLSDDSHARARMRTSHRRGNSQKNLGTLLTKCYTTTLTFSQTVKCWRAKDHSFPETMPHPWRAVPWENQPIMKEKEAVTFAHLQSLTFFVFCPEL